MLKLSPGWDGLEIPPAIGLSAGVAVSFPAPLPSPEFDPDAAPAFAFASLLPLLEPFGLPRPLMLIT